MPPSPCGCSARNPPRRSCVVGAVQGGKHLADTDRIAGQLDVAAVRGGLRHLTGQRGRRHLAAGHAIDAVVDKDYGDILTAGGCMDGLSGADGGQDRRRPDR